MFGLFKPNPEKAPQKLEQAYQNKLTEAFNAQRKGNIRSYSLLTAEAEDIAQQIAQLSPAGKLSLSLQADFG